MPKVHTEIEETNLTFKKEGKISVVELENSMKENTHKVICSKLR